MLPWAALTMRSEQGSHPVVADRVAPADIAATGCRSPAQRPCSNFGTNHKRVLLIRAGQLGDTIWATAAVEAIRQTFGSSVEIDFLIKQGLKSLFQYDTRITRVFEIRHRHLPLLLNPAKLAVLAASWQRTYDLAIDLETSPLFAGLMHGLCAHQKVCARHLNTVLNRHAEHAVIEIRRVLERCLPADSCDKAHPSLVPPAIDPRRRFNLPQHYICLHPGNSHLAAGRATSRAWSASHWRTVLEGWKTVLPEGLREITPVLVGQPSEAALAQELARDLLYVEVLCGKTGLPALMALIAASDLTISTDTGLSHLAAALNIPVIALFGPTDPHQTGPFPTTGNAVWVLDACGLHSGGALPPFHKNASLNMDSITPQAMFRAIQKMLHVKHRKR
jgi:heptosyltransferase I